MEPSVSHVEDDVQKHFETDFEKDAVISGIGISRIGRRTGVPGLELTLDAARSAIADAGLEPSDIDGIATLGDTPRRQVVDALGLDAQDRGSGIDTSGLYSPLMSAFLAVSQRRSRHVLVYRTVAMLGGAMIGNSAELPPEPNALLSPPDEPRVPGQPRTIGTNGDIGELLAAHAYSAAGTWSSTAPPGSNSGGWPSTADATRR